VLRVTASDTKGERPPSAEGGGGSSPLEGKAEPTPYGGGDPFGLRKFASKAKHIHFYYISLKKSLPCKKWGFLVKINNF